MSNPIFSLKPKKKLEKAYSMYKSIIMFGSSLVILLILFKSIFALNYVSHSNREGDPTTTTTYRPDITSTTTTSRILSSAKSAKNNELFNFEENFPILYKYSSSSDAPNLFKEYLIRGQYGCTAKYMDVLTRLNALMKEAYAEHELCRKAIMKTPTYESTEFDSLNELLDEWKDSDKNDMENSGATVTKKPPVTNSNNKNNERVNDIVNLREAQLFV